MSLEERHARSKRLEAMDVRGALSMARTAPASRVSWASGPITVIVPMGEVTWRASVVACAPLDIERRWCREPRDMRATDLTSARRPSKLIARHPRWRHAASELT